MSEESPEQLRQRIEAGARARAARVSPLRLERLDGLADELRQLARAIEDLDGSMNRFGEVTSTRAGVAGRLETLVKALLRKLVRRHIDQQRDVHAALRAVLLRLQLVLARQVDLLDVNFERLRDEARRRGQGDRDG